MLRLAQAAGAGPGLEPHRNEPEQEGHEQQGSADAGSSRQRS